MPCPLAVVDRLPYVVLVHDVVENRGDVSLRAGLRGIALEAGWTPQGQLDPPGGPLADGGYVGHRVAGHVVAEGDVHAPAYLAVRHVDPAGQGHEPVERHRIEHLGIRRAHEWGLPLHRRVQFLDGDLWPPDVERGGERLRVAGQSRAVVPVRYLLVVAGRVR